ncbi:MAG TPA: hypothetical protein VJH03_12240 [Blastocatellia bacterium]|nr:hypothetical protein [Blastocatellia bacterium]
MKPKRTQAKLFGALLASLLLAPVAAADSGDQPPALSQSNPQSHPAARVRFVRAFVIDDRLSAVRRDANIRGEVIERLRLGRRVFIIKTFRGGQDEAVFYRIAVTRRTRGWIHQAALAVPGVSGDDKRILKLAESAADGFDRITLCKLLVENFRRSPLVPRALLMIGEEAELSAESLSARSRKRLAEVETTDARATLRDYYLSDPWLDRYSRLGVAFDFNEANAEYVYDGRTYRELLKRFPGGAEASRARELLNHTRQKLARQ